MIAEQERMGIGAGLVLAYGLMCGGAWGEEPSLSALGVSTAGIGEERFDPSPTANSATGARHEALLASQTGARDREDDRAATRVPKRPPPAVAERPGADPHKPDAQWVSGYWAWDANRRDYIWVTGAWQVPPPGKFWVNGYWRRDGQEWYRVAGFWSARADRNEEPEWDWRAKGPPSPPTEEIGPAPGPDHFFVAGVYAPNDEGKKLVWTAGYWYPTHNGWEWIPARWVQRSSGWVYRKGWWRRVDPARADKDDDQSPTPPPTPPPGYPMQTYTPRYGYAPFGGRFGWFINQVLP